MEKHSRWHWGSRRALRTGSTHASHLHPCLCLYHIFLSVSPRPRGSLVLYFSPVTPTPPVVVPPSATAEAALRLPSAPSSLLLQGGGGGQSPALRLHWGRWGYNAASRAGSCQLVITAKKETHACAQEHTHIPACSRVNQGGHRLATVLSKSSMGMPGERCTQK